MVATASPAAWRWPTRVLFRFIFAYLLLYNLPGPLGSVPYGVYAAYWYKKAWDSLASHAGEWILGRKVAFVPNGSGDTTFHYIQALVTLALALAACLVWSVLDRRRRAYPVLHEALTVYVRYVLATAMLGYGYAKVFKSQFPFPGYESLISEFGQTSPMGLLWNFMGYSTPYTVFAGACEVVGGVLLFWRRTAVLGALLLMGVMGNVMLLNFFYDVPVKLYSTHLFLMTLFLLAPHVPRLAACVTLRRVVPGPPSECPWNRGLWRWVALACTTIAGGYFTIAQGLGGYEVWKTYGEAAPSPPHYGVYAVESFARDGVEVPPLTTDHTRWRRVIFNRHGMMTIQHMPGTLYWYRMTLDEAASTVMLTDFGGGSPRALRYTRPGEGVFVFEGEENGHAIRARLRRVDDKTFPLKSGGFHWIRD
ncbi:MAG: hypothetical protein HBSAPP03_28930 [Phycisphaerae bacterium]|nr:MAG: hypothetical protein HBSAPP03_28930 [Phycisphaerae bacterium]